MSACLTKLTSEAAANSAATTQRLDQTHSIPKEATVTAPYQVSLTIRISAGKPTQVSPHYLVGGRKPLQSKKA